MDIGKKIAQLRKEKGWSQSQFGQMIDISQYFVSQWETGKSVPSAGSLIKISRIFRVSIDYLLLDNVPKEGVSSIDDFELYETFKAADSLSSEERTMIKDFVSALVFRRKVKQAERDAERSKRTDKETESPPLRKVAGKR
jgi:transcriptional regulator with XRE-family HTH domain